VRTNLGGQVPGYREAFTRHPVRPHRLGRRIALGLLAAASLNCCGAFAARSEQPTATIRVRVFNYTRATRATVAAAERGAGQILRDAGLNVIWMDCRFGESLDNPSGPCQQPLSPTEVLLRVLPDRHRNGIADDAFGFAVPPLLANVYYEHVTRLARIEGYEVTSILAGIIAHEIGHLMLGTSNHSETGLMQRHWGRIQLQSVRCGGLQFTPQQSKLIRAEGQRRMLLESTRSIVASSMSHGPPTN